jgi:glycosyltransferase involved in cell wall biosynthesis
MRILHVFRSPVGGLFRHVRDLAAAQTALGHEVGIFCDSSTGGQTAINLLEASSKNFALGIHRQAISKLPGLGDITSAYAAKKLAQNLKVDIIHGHGAKGGLYGRLAGKLSGIASVYSPHGGSLHHDWKKFPGLIYLTTEWLLGYAGSGFIFVCHFEKTLFSKKIGLAGRPSAIVHNGLWPEEFTPAVLNKDATDLLFVGELRHLKGIDVLLNSFAELRKTRNITLTVVGEGPDKAKFEQQAAELNLGSAVRFVGRFDINASLKMGRLLVIPSRNESFPYVVLEAVAASTEVLASNVGGIPEILPPNMLFKPDDVVDLTAKLDEALGQPNATKFAAQMLAEKAKDQFSASNMANQVCAFYKTVITN